MARQKVDKAKKLEKQLEAAGWRWAGLFEYPSAVNSINKLLKPFGLKLRTKTNYRMWADGMWLLLERIEGRADFELKLREAITYYASGVSDGHYEQLMDELTNTCTEAQWKEVEAALEKVDEWMADTDQATLAQKEDVAARREGRKSRYPGTLVRTLMTKDEINNTLRLLEKEHGIKAPDDAFEQE